MAHAKSHKNSVPVEITWSFLASAVQRPEVLPGLPEEVANPERYVEGATKTISVNIYERNPQAREACLAVHGYRCSVCDFCFETAYGELGRRFIHVHHLKQLADIGAEYKLDPVTDLRPVCPNCHAMLHRRRPPYTIEELAELRNAASDAESKDR